ncbi:MAG: efflux RND transporter periplasmic adaptor subunit [Puia sp.]|nr:efflux RND transporter periplasmic adaptor subunit [Puia sp.]
MKFIYLLLFLPAFGMVSCQTKKNAHPGQQTAEGEQQYYTCSMHPQVMLSKPGKCPICGMQLIEVKKTLNDHSDDIVLNDEQIRLGNIMTDSVTSTGIGDKIYLTATLTINQHKTTSISSRVMGRVEKLYFKNTGDYVKQGEKLFDIYSEDLNTAKQEYLLTLQQQSLVNNAPIDYTRLLQSAKNKLLLWGLTENQIKELALTNHSNSLTTFYSPVSGSITALDLKEGDYVMEGGSIVHLADLSTLWVEAQAYTSQLAQLDQKGAVLVQIPDMPDKAFSGRIEYANPEINPDTRIDLIRVSIPNKDGQLKPGMPAYVIISSTKHPALTLPIDAVLRDSKSATVWVSTSRNSFVSRMVQTGLETGDRIEIVSGLKPGDRVVISGAYLLNSEYKFKKGSSPMAGMKM